MADDISSDKDTLGWFIGKHYLPLPRHASQAMMTSLRGSDAPAVEREIQSTPRSKATLQALAEQVEEKRKIYKEILLKNYPVSVHKTDLAGVQVRYIEPREVDSQHKDRLFVEVHGGAFLWNGGENSIIEAILIASRLKMRVLSIDYRLLPAHAYPKALDDVVTVYKAVIQGRKPSSVILGGTSAGGNLVLAAIHRLHHEKVPLPAALYVGTPWADLTKTSDSLFVNEGADRDLVTYDGLLSEAAKKYSATQLLTHPLVSPLYGDFSYFPPTYTIAGTRDLLLSDTVRIHRKLRESGVTADLNIYEGMSHADYLYVSDSSESQQVYKELNSFLLKVMPSQQEGFIAEAGPQAL